MNDLSQFSAGTRVRVIPGATIGSRIAAGRVGTVVAYREEHIPMLEEFPIAAVLDGRKVSQVWKASELEIVDE